MIVKSVIAGEYTGPAGARPEHERDLRHDARGERVAQEDVGVAAERHDAFLDPCAAGIVEPDDRRAGAHGEIHDLADLLGVRLRERSAENREVLAEHEHQPPVDRSVASDDAVTEVALLVEPEVGCPVRDERVELDERLRVQQQIESLAGGQLAAFVLLRDAFLAPTEPRLLAQRLESFDFFVLRRHSQPPPLQISGPGGMGCAARAAYRSNDCMSTDSVNNSAILWIT